MIQKKMSSSTMAEDGELDPRIQIELENLNSATDEINKLEIELEEANSTFRILLNESTRRLKLSSKKLGSCIEKARPYYEALEKSREAQIQCQKAAVKFQRANEIHIAAKETVALAEQRFMSNSHEWQFDNAWQEMLNHATQKVMDAEKQKADCHLEHQRLTRIFNAAEQKVQQLEERFRRSIAKSRPYFEEKQICQDQLQTQKNRIQELQSQVQGAKNTYATALRNLERISNEIHRQRGDYPLALQQQQSQPQPPPGPREPGVGAELNTPTTPTMPSLPDFELELEKCDYSSIAGSQLSLGASSFALASLTASSLAIDDADHEGQQNAITAVDDELEECEADYAEGSGVADMAGVVNEKDLEELRQKVKILAVRPIEGGDGQQEQNDMWEMELNATVDKLDHLLLMKECAKQQLQQQQQQHQHHHHHQQQMKLKENSKLQQHDVKRPQSLGAEAVTVGGAKQHVANGLDDDAADVVIVSGSKGPLIQVSCTQTNSNNLSLPVTPQHLTPAAIKKLQKLEPLPSVNVSMRELPLLARLSTEVVGSGFNKQRRRSLE